MQSEAPFFFSSPVREFDKKFVGRKEAPESLEASMQWAPGPGQMGKAAEAFSGADFAVAGLLYSSSLSLYTDGY